MALHESFDTLPLLEPAHNMFKDRNAETYLNGPIRDIFLKHNMQDQYGISLLHRHFSMDPDERLVEYGAVSTPWTVPQTDDHEIEALGGYIVPQNYRLNDNDDLCPFEFEMQYERPSGGNGTTPEFLHDLNQILREHSLSDVFGLRKRGPTTDLKVEITQGRANIMIRALESNEQRAVPAFWAFGPGENEEAVCRIICYINACGVHQFGHANPL